MHIHKLQTWQHSHQFHVDNSHGEKNTRRVIMLTFVMMVVEIVAGLSFGSMALLADGWHMGTHVAALGITALAYWYARRHANDPRYSFGTGKVGILGGFASAIALAAVALFMAVESIERLFSDVTIQFNEAIAVAIIGLIVNLVSAYLLHGKDHHHRGHDHHHDHNLRAAYLHVLADAMTSIFAIIALLAGKSLGWIWLDAVIGIVGALVITRWSYDLVRETGKILLDSSPPPEFLTKIRAAIEVDKDNRVTDLHVWQINPYHSAAIVAITTHYPQPVEHYKHLLAKFDNLVHISIELNHCTDAPCLSVD